MYKKKKKSIIRYSEEWKVITYKQLVDRLSSVFAGQAELHHLVQLRGRLQQQHESLQDFAQSVRRLTDNAYPGMAEEARNRIARDHFMSIIRENEIRSTVHLSRPKSMEAALQTAVEMEAFLTSEKLREQPKFTGEESIAEHEKG